MKWVRLAGQGVPVRVTNAEAVKLVEIDKDGEYCPNHVAREWWDACKDERFKAKHMAAFDRNRASADPHTPPQKHKHHHGSMTA
jgi:hypothetical protein